ncbi:MAG TPA: ASKHA domain-containing protein [Dehalococcoidia bacterium]
MPAQVEAPARSFRVRFANLDRETICSESETIFHAARRAAIRIVGACGGRGVCGTCMVRVVSGDIESLQPEPAQAAQRSPWVRACQARPLTELVLEAAPRSVATIVRAEVDGQGPQRVRPAPAVTVHQVALAPPTLSDVRADADRLLDALADCGAKRLDLQALRELPGVLRGSGWQVQALVRGDEVIGVTPVGARCLGLAVDLGTTNCAGFLLDLETGTRLASLGIENPQVGYGADLVSRLNYAIRSPEASAELRRAAVTAITELARDLCEAVSAGADEIVDVAVCGNTAMHHLLLGLPVRQLGRVPFVPAVQEALDLKARDVGLTVAPGAYVHVLPNIGGFVGADHAATLLATEDRWKLGTTIVMDIGTNTEISLIHAGEITTVSCPSGPAFEGGHIGAGMRAAEGAIERVSVEDGRLEVQVIGEAEPVGLCGSGVLDAAAALLKAGLVNQGGTVLRGHPYVQEEDGRRSVMLAPDVAFTQGDVRAVQLAKAAIRCGIDLLLREAGLAEAALDQVVIAGAFGTYINIESAVAIGMLPPLPLERFAQVGNAAGVGVAMALASTTLRERAQRLAAQCRYIELGSLPGFEKAFLGRLPFSERGRR